jgi:hypothetical protein
MNQETRETWYTTEHDATAGTRGDGSEVFL